MDELNAHLRRESGEEAEAVDFEKHGNADEDIFGSGILDDED
jgi:hypothetical protein